MERPRNILIEDSRVMSYVLYLESTVRFLEKKLKEKEKEKEKEKPQS